MTELEVTQRALTELGTTATVAEVTRFALEQYGLTLDPRFVPLYLATIRGEWHRRQMRAIAASATAASPS